MVTQPRRGSMALALLLAALTGLSVAAAPQQTGDSSSSLTPQQQAAAEIANAETTAREVLRLRQHQDFDEANRRDAELAGLLERARRLLGFAKDGLTRAERSQSATGFSDAALLARRAARQFATYEEQVKSAFAAIEVERSPPPPPPPPPPPEVVIPDDAEATPEPVAVETATVDDTALEKESDVAESTEAAGSAETASPIVEPPSVESAITEPAPAESAAAEPVETTTVESSSTGPVRSEAAEPDPSDVDEVPTSNLGPPKAPPTRSSEPLPNSLLEAADAFFASDYDTTIRLLSVASSAQPGARAHAFLLRSAARYALFLLGGETDYALRGQASDDVIACRRADPEVVPDEAAFSPRFRDFFAGTR